MANAQNDEGDPRRLGLLDREARPLNPDTVASQEAMHTDNGNPLPLAP